MQIFVIDGTGDIAAAEAALVDIAAHPAIQHMPLLVLVHKADLPGCLTPEQVCLPFKYYAIANHMHADPERPQRVEQWKAIQHCIIKHSQQTGPAGRVHVVF